jgi:hypothetical protein
MKTSRVVTLIGLSLLIGFFAGWHFGLRDLKTQHEQTIQNMRQVMLASKIYALTYSNNPAAVAELLTNQPALKP